MKFLSKTLLFSLVVIVGSLFLTTSASAATRTIANGGGNWNSTGTWVEGAVPTSSDAVVATSSSGQLTVNVAGQAASIDFTNYTNTLTMNSTLTVSGNVTLVSAMTIAGSSGLIVNAASTLTSHGKTWPNSLTLTGTSLTYTLADNWTISGSLVLSGTTASTINGNTLNVGSGITQSTTATISGTTSIVLNGTGTWSNSSTGVLQNPLTINTAGTITISGSVTYNTGTLTYTVGTVVTTGSTLSIGATTTLNTTGINWNNITLSGTSTDTLSSNLTVNGTFTVSGVTTFAGTGNLVFGSSSTWTGSSAVSIPTSLILTSGMTNSYTGAITFTSTSGTQSITTNGISLASNLTFNGVGGTWQLATPLATTGTLTLTSGTLTQNNQAITVAGLTGNGGNFTGSAANLIDTGDFTLSSGIFTAPSTTFIVQGNFNRSGGTFTHNSGTVLFNPGTATTLTNTQAFNNLTLGDGLIGYWKLDETSGISAADSSGYANTGTLTNGPTHSSSVPTTSFTNPKSVLFDGVDDYINMGNSASLAVSGNVSISTWIKWDGNVNGFDTIIANRLGFGSDYQLILYGGDLAYYGAGGFYVSSYVPTIGVWTHLVATVNGTTLTFYANGVQVYTTPCSPSSVVTGSLFTIGGDTQDIFASEYFGGNIDDLRIYNRALSQSEITQLASGNQSTSNTTTQSLGSSVTIAGSLSLNNAVLDTSSSNYGINVAGNWQNNAGTFTSRAGTVTFNGTNQTLTGSNSFYGFTKSVTSADTLTLPASQTQTISPGGSLQLSGASGQALLSLRSSTPGTPFKLAFNGLNQIANFLDVKDSNASSLTLQETNSTNSGNNTNWSFPASSAPGYQAPTVGSGGQGSLVLLSLTHPNASSTISSGLSTPTPPVVPNIAPSTSNPSTGSGQAPNFLRYLGRGDHGQDVLALQQLLQTLSFFPQTIQPNGYFGPATQKAVKLFQKSHGISMTGNVGPLTLKVLNSL